MRPKDIKECVQIIADHPVIGPRYGETLPQLGAAWSHLLGQEAFTGIVFEEINGSRVRKVAVGTRLFVSDAFVAEMKTAPHFWVAPELVRRIVAGKSPALTNAQVRAANRDGGLNLLVLEGAMRTADMGRPEIMNILFGVFVEYHRGFLLKELITQGTSTDMMKAQLQSGGYLVDHQGRYVPGKNKLLDELLRAPHFIGVSRELALQDFGSWMSSMFVYHAPRFGFRPSEQRLLLAALSGGTDEELSDELAISMSAVKKNWRQIYERVAPHDSTLVPSHYDEDRNSERGKTKKQRLLAYLREHMEELRPTQI